MIGESRILMIEDILGRVHVLRIVSKGLMNVRSIHLDYILIRQL